MTTTVRITHEGPDILDVLVTPTGPETNRQDPMRLHAGDSLSVYFWGKGGFTITEVEKEQE